ncbi:MAG: hypothetical protein IPK42_06635 [Betaproteobacteria bacterium]|nr:hypothetical protein [Betaproteobacteria bacterium]
MQAVQAVTFGLDPGQAQLPGAGNVLGLHRGGGGITLAQGDLAFVAVDELLGEVPPLVVGALRQHRLHGGDAGAGQRHAGGTFLARVFVVGGGLQLANEPGQGMPFNASVSTIVAAARKTTRSRCGNGRPRWSAGAPRARWPA